MNKLSNNESVTLATLLAEQGRYPDGMVRHNGVVYVRYVLEFWCISKGNVVKFTGISPNPGITPGAIAIH